MRFNRSKPDRSEFEVVVTSMLDINFLLIMFFMMTAHFQRETHAELDLPKERGDAQVQPDEAGLVINITDTGQIIVSGAALDMDQLRRRVRQQSEAHGDSDGRTKLMVRVDRRAPTAHLNRVVTMLREEHVGVIRVATETPL